MAYSQGDMVQVKRPPHNKFAEEPDIRLSRSQFDRSHGVKMTFDASYLVPFMVDEVLPGDTFTCKLNGFARIFSPLDAPVMDNIELETFFFFVPNRIIWNNWEAFQGAHDAAGAQDTDFTIPILSQSAGLTADHAAAHTAQSRFLAFMGLPDGIDVDSVAVNALPFRAYQLIYNDWFRDQNLIDEEVFVTGDGPDPPSQIGTLEKSAKKHDYFTSALPYLQKGDAQTVALTGEAPITGFGVADQAPSQTGPLTAYETEGTGGSSFNDSWTSTELLAEEDLNNTGFPNIYANLSAGGAVDINALRQSVAIQRLLERDARGGTRYTEIIKSHFGVTSPDFRLQRPEYLGGGKSYINFSPVAATTDAGNEEVGELHGIGTGIVSGHGWAKSFTEHGHIIGILRARGDLTYFQGLDKMWSRQTRFDYYMPALANLGEQAVLNKEIFVSNSAGTDDAVFGYQERWQEYRTKQSRLVGFFNPDTTGSIDFWHLAEDFSALPSLNQTFIEDQTPMSRIVTSSSADDFLLDLWINLKAARPIPVHSIPSLIGNRF